MNADEDVTDKPRRRKNKQRQTSLNAFFGPQHNFSSSPRYRKATTKNNAAFTTYRCATPTKCGTTDVSRSISLDKNGDASGKTKQQPLELKYEANTKMPRFSAAEKQRRYRARRDADPARRKAFLEKCRQKWKQ